MSSLYEESVIDIQGNEADLEPYRGQVLLIVNTASECGFTGQYKGLQALYEKFQARGLAVLGFPCNQFGQQEPGTSEDIAAFCDTRFRVNFPLFEKVEVNGPNTHPLFGRLKTEAPGLLGTQKIKWNFTKFLVDRQGKVVKRFAPVVTPEEIEAHVEALL
jgi:glutathione peroxidase